MIPFGRLDDFLAKRVRFFRKKKNLPLKTLADELGISLQQLQRYEQGVNKISASLLYQLAHLFQVTIETFFEGYHPTETLEPVNLQVLLVEDNAHDEFLFRKAFSKFPQKVDIYVIGDGEKALRFFQNPLEESSLVFEPDIIFLDLNLPHLRGFDLLEHLKHKPSWKNIPVIILSNSLSEDDVTQSYALQASGFIRKSFNFEDFCHDLEKTLLYWHEAVKLPLKNSKEEA